jgi:hypothetical protein
MMPDLGLMRLALGKRLPHTALLAIFELAWHLLLAREHDVIVCSGRRRRRIIFMVNENISNSIPIRIDMPAYAQMIGVEIDQHINMEEEPFIPNAIHRVTQYAIVLYGPRQARFILRRYPVDAEEA